jgi:hypothetical protein
MMLRYSAIVFLFAPCAIGLALLTSNTAVATCGDWTIHGAKTGIPKNIRFISDTVARPVTLLTAALNHETSRGPCHGPNCQSAPSQPAPVMPVTFPRIDSVMLAIRGAVGDSSAESCSSFAEDCARAVRGFPLGIEHPPRV